MNERSRREWRQAALFMVGLFAVGIIVSLVATFTLGRNASTTFAPTPNLDKTK